MTGSFDKDTERLYKDFDNAGLMPLWNLRDEVMAPTPTPKAVPHIWHWDELYPLAARAGELVPVGRGGERRAIAVSNPGLAGLPYATPTLWAAIQYLGPNEVAPSHRHSPNAFRFVLEGEGVWTVVDGDPVAMRRGDLLLTAGWCFHGHHNPRDEPMAWLDGLDVPFVNYTDTGFFEFGEDGLDDRSTPQRSRSERLWGHPGLRPLTAPSRAPLAAFRWEHTDAALSDQLDMAEGPAGPGHAAVRFVNPATGGDALSTMRMEMHRIDGARTEPRREAASTVWQVFEGTGAITLDGTRRELRRGDLIAVPSWCAWSVEGDLDLFRFTDAPIFERLGLYREQV